MTEPGPREETNITIQDAAWIAGHWRGEAFGGIADEVWSPPLGRSMMGMYQLLQDDEVAFYEFLTITEEDGSLLLRLKHFDPQMVGWEEKDQAQIFRLVRVTLDEVHFDGLVFRRTGFDSLQVSLKMRRDDGTTQEMHFDYRRLE
jgi:hypothetical protein